MMQFVIDTSILGNAGVSLAIIAAVAKFFPSNTEANKDGMKFNGERVWK